MIEDGLVPELLLGQKYGHALHFWDLAEGRHLQTVDLGAQHQMVLELRPVARPRGDLGLRRRGRLHRGPVGVGLALAPRRRPVGARTRSSRSRPSRPTRRPLPPALQPFGAVPPLVTDIDLSVDDRMLYVSCWGTGELKQYDVSDPAHPREVGSVRLGGIVGRAAHPAAPGRARWPAAPQMVEVSRDGRRVYITNSLYGAWDDQFYPDGVGAWMAKIDADPAGGLSVDERFFPHGDDFRGLRAHQVRLQGGDASSDSYCYR